MGLMFLLLLTLNCDPGAWLGAWLWSRGGTPGPGQLARGRDAGPLLGLRMPRLKRVNKIVLDLKKRFF